MGKMRCCAGTVSMKRGRGGHDAGVDSVGRRWMRVVTMLVSWMVRMEASKGGVRGRERVMTR